MFSCVKVLYEACRNNKDNQRYVAEFMPIILSHCGTEPLAAKITQELLSTNRELQETKITAKDINIFSMKIKESGMTTMFLRLLQSCCSNNGEGIPRNQNNVQQILFDKHRDALIHIMVTSDGFAGMTGDWNVDASTLSLFTPALMDGKDILGSNLYTGISIRPTTQKFLWTSLTAIDPSPSVQMASRGLLSPGSARAPTSRLKLYSADPS